MDITFLLNLFYTFLETFVLILFLGLHVGLIDKRSSLSPEGIRLGNENIYRIKMFSFALLSIGTIICKKQLSHIHICPQALPSLTL